MIQELPHFRKPPCMKFNEIGPATRPATKPNNGERRYNETRKSAR